MKIINFTNDLLILTADRKNMVLLQPDIEFIDKFFDKNGMSIDIEKLILEEIDNKVGEALGILEGEGNYIVTTRHASVLFQLVNPYWLSGVYYLDEDPSSMVIGKDGKCLAHTRLIKAIKP